MNLSIKTYLLASELEFIASHVSRRTVTWCVTDGTRLRLYAKDRGFTIETMVPLFGMVAESVSFGVNAGALLVAAQGFRKPVVTLTVDGLVRLGSYCLNPFLGPTPERASLGNQQKPSVSVSQHSLRTVLKTAKPFASSDQIPKHYPRGITFEVERRSVKSRSAVSYYIFEHVLIGQPLNEAIEAFVPAASVSAISELSPVRSGRIDISVSPEETVFRCSPRLVRIASTPHCHIPFIDPFLQKTALTPMFAVNVDAFRSALQRISTARNGTSRKVKLITANRTLTITAAWEIHRQRGYEFESEELADETIDVDDADFEQGELVHKWIDVTEAEEQISAQCWQESSFSLDGEKLLTFLRGVPPQQALVVRASVDEKVPAIFEASGQRLALARME